jgi:hypothetical protein
VSSAWPLLPATILYYPYTTKHTHMQTWKKVLLVIAIIIAIPLVVALFVKKDFAVEREVTINRPKADVFGYIRLLKNQDNFSIWASKDPHIRKSYRGTDGTVGFVSAWDSDSTHVGKGEQEITGIREGERVDYELRFKKPFESKSQAHISTEAVSENQTKVKWGFAGSMPYPMNLMNLFMNMDKSVGNEFQTGLNNLKGILEKQ